MLRATDAYTASLSRPGRTTAFTIILLTGIVVAGLCPITIVAQEKAAPETEQQKPGFVANPKVSPDQPTSAQSSDDEVKNVLADLDTDDVAGAETLLTEKLRQRPEDPELRFRLALIMGELGKSDGAYAIMQQLVETKRDPRAARWIVHKRYDKRKWQDLSKDERDEFGLLAKLTHEVDPEDASAANFYADYLIASGDFAGAFPVLRDLAKTNPLRGLQAAAVARRLKRDGEANAIAKRSLDALNQLSQKEQQNLSISLALAQNQLFLKRFSEAIETLEEALKHAKSPREQALARQALDDANVVMVRHIETESNGSIEGRKRILQMLLRAIERSPKNPRVATTIDTLLDQTRNSTDEQILELRRLLIEAASQSE